MGNAQSPANNEVVYDASSECKKWIDDYKCKGGCEEFRKCACDSYYYMESPCSYHPSCQNSNYCTEGFTGNIIEGNVNLDQGLELGKLIDQGQGHVNRSNVAANTIQQAVKPTLQNEQATRQSLINTQSNERTTNSLKKDTLDASLDAKTNKELAKQQAEEAEEQRRLAEEQRRLAEEQRRLANIHQKDALESANKTQELQQDTQVLNSNTQSDVNALQQTVGLHTNTGNTAAVINRKLRELEEKEGQLGQLETSIPLSREQVEEHLFSFQSDGYPYLEGLDENLKINILTHMVRYMQDFADIYREFYTEMIKLNQELSSKKLRRGDERYEEIMENYRNIYVKFTESIPEWIKNDGWSAGRWGPDNINYDVNYSMYYYIKYNYENSGSETLGYQVFLNIKNVITTMFEVNTSKNPPGSIFKTLNSNSNEYMNTKKYTYYLENKSKQPFTNIKEYFTNLIEGNTGMSGTTTDPLVQNNDNFIDIVRGFLDTTQSSLNIDRTNLENSINNIKRYQDGEFLAQRDTIMNNVLMDYMINNKEGSNIEQVYGKLNQEKNDKLRKTKIAAYYTKSFKEYIYLLKIVIFLIVLMIPILIFNRLEILDKSLTLLLVVTIITLGFLYISYRLYILYTRDSKDFDKFKIPFTRTEAANLKSKGSRYSKDSPLKSLGITCIGEECCDASMVYDKLRDKCVATENFGNYFENAQQLNNQQKNIIKENNSHEDESNFAFLGGNANVIENFRSMEGIKQRLLLDSLNNSSERTF